MGVCVLQVTLAYESIVLYMCEGKVLMDIKTGSTGSERRARNEMTESANNAPPIAKSNSVE